MRLFFHSFPCEILSELKDKRKGYGPSDLPFRLKTMNPWFTPWDSRCCSEAPRFCSSKWRYWKWLNFTAQNTVFPGGSLWSGPRRELLTCTFYIWTYEVGEDITKGYFHVTGPLWQPDRWNNTQGSACLWRHWEVTASHGKIKSEGTTTTGEHAITAQRKPAESQVTGHMWPVRQSCFPVHVPYTSNWPHTSALTEPL